ncbi:MAG: hypothetical protein UW15_C0006G0026, partial [Parcubacteria group bacterium GW2011_GWC1_44_10]
KQIIILLGFLIFGCVILLAIKAGLKKKHTGLLKALLAILLLGTVDHYFLTLQQTRLLLAVVLGLIL